MAVNPLIQRLARVRNPYTPGAVTSQASQASRDQQLQATVAKMSPQQATTGLAQQIGGTLAQLANQQKMQQVQTAAPILEQQGQLALQQQQTQVKSTMQGLARGVEESKFQDEQRIASLSESAKQQVFDLRKQFSADEAGRKFTNERQLAEFKLATASSDEAFKDYQQKAELVLDRKRQVTAIALSKITQELMRQQELRDQVLNYAQDVSIDDRSKATNASIVKQRNKQIEELSRAKNSLEVSMIQAKADAQAALARGQMLGSVLGAGLGAAVTGDPTGAVIGSQIGGGIGTVASGSGV